jgi:Phage tail protein
VRDLTTPPLRTEIAGLTWGVADDAGVRWGARLDGWNTRPAPKGDLPVLDGLPGSAAVPRFYGPRPLTLTGLVVAPTAADAVAANEAVELALTPGAVRDLELVVYESPPKRLAVRVDGPIDTPWVSAVAFTVSAPLIAPDPLKYSTDRFSTFTGPRATSTSGRTYPTRYPYGYGTSIAGAAGGEFTLVNLGTQPVPVVFRIDGPTPAGATVSIPATGEALTVGAALLAGHWVTLDTRLRQVIYDGVTSRREWLSPGYDWMTIPPGETVVRFTVPSGTTGRLTVLDFSGAWL